ncbi:hypothetical protein HYDPIDRAFT_174116 [Hydnomerulius pinastri MD-312]|nr:hypothetical protein HYDPIDRAFT_174116 [Hydnomerulius pinastri MD-312]
MAVLVQLPGTRLYRGALLPMVLWMALRVGITMDFSWGYPGLAYLNQGQALGMFTLAMRSTAWTFVQEPYARQLSSSSAQPVTNGDHGNSTPKPKAVTIPSAMWNAWDLMMNMRGIGWNWPQRLHIPKPYFQVQSRLVFFALSLARLALFALAFDAVSGYVRSFSPDAIGSPNGGTIFDPSLPPLARYMRSSTITVLSGTSAYLIIEAVYQLHAVEFIMLFQQYPSQWPPLFDSPWLSTSLSGFWGQRWHQLFREYFVAVGGRPLEGRFGRAGIVLGAFVVSGALHDLGMRGMGRGADTLPVVGFFVMHGLGVMMEYTWKKATGKRVGGVLGWLWTFSWFVIWGNFIVDVWARRGLIGSEFVPEPYRPTTLLLNLLGQRQ